ncbi:F-box protein At3g07870-like [Papaver somniferum]|uniref:F-box protein At3g07870-like n=1 Tax=Papaver somniferum TaxID=3469 RepID=UPI000E704A5C|nr:F-box protein At3g07870-like [Papaver somniferum]
MHGNYSYTTLVEIDKHRPVELEPLSDMVGSCNGLVCFSVRRKFTIACDPIYICNPMTEEYVYLPTFNYDKPYNDAAEAGCFDCGFGYHHYKDEYKVVRIHRVFVDFKRQSQKVQVYTLGSGHGWRDKGSIDHLLASDNGVCANGAIHWVEYRKNKIVAFDLADEEFRLIPLPPHLPQTSQYNEFDTISLKLLGCQLCVVHLDIGKVEDVIHIWALEKKKTFSSTDMKGWYDQFDDKWRRKKKFSIPCTKGEIYIYVVCSYKEKSSSNVV